MYQEMLDCIWRLAVALFLTIILEFPVIWFGMMRFAENQKKIFGNFLLINGITNLTLNVGILLILMIHGRSFWVETYIVELIIPMMEAIMFAFTTKEFSWKRLLITCYIANAVSFLLGGWLLSIWG